jgi:hypothetical protein
MNTGSLPLAYGFFDSLKGAMVMTSRLFAFGIILAFAFVLHAQGANTVKIEGYIMDNACAAGHVKDANFGDRVKKHSTSCALQPSCAESGYMVYTADAKVYKLDQAGNKSAEELLKETDTKMGVQVSVEGTIDGDTIKVTRITEKTN